MEIQVFELSEIAKILAMKFTKAKNWTVGRPFTIEPSIRTAPRRGSPSLYSLDDLYLMGAANEFSKAGMAAKAIGRMLDAVKAKYPNGLGGVEWLTVWRPPRKLTFQVRTGRADPPAGVVLWHTVNVAGMVARINTAVTK